MKKFLKILLIVCIMLGIGLTVYFAFKKLLPQNAESADAVRSNINFGWLVLFVFLQVIQVIFVPLSGQIVTIPCLLIFKNWQAFLISWIGISIGSIIMYFIGRSGGSKLLEWVVGKEKAEKYSKFLSKGIFLFPITMLIPIFPDDIMSCCAGIAKLNKWYCIAVILITRALCVASTCFLGSAMIKSTWGIILLCVFVIAMVAVAIITTKKQDKINAWFVKKFGKKEK